MAMALSRRRGFGGQRGCSVAGPAFTSSAPPPKLPPVPSDRLPPLPTMLFVPVGDVPHRRDCASHLECPLTDMESLSGSMCGAPFSAAMCTSGPLWKIPSPLWARFSLGRGAFCSAVIHASAFGSGCGTGTPNATSFALASASYFERG